jgi:hypothetical protein
MHASSWCHTRAGGRWRHWRRKRVGNQQERRQQRGLRQRLRRRPRGRSWSSTSSTQPAGSRTLLESATCRRAVLVFPFPAAISARMQYQMLLQTPPAWSDPSIVFDPVHLAWNTLTGPWCEDPWAHCGIVVTVKQPVAATCSHQISVRFSVLTFGVHDCRNEAAVRGFVPERF